MWKSELRVAELETEKLETEKSLMVMDCLSHTFFYTRETGNHYLD